MLCVQGRSPSMSPSFSTSWQQLELKVKRAHPKSFTRPLEDAVIVPSSSTVYSAEMLSWRKRPSGSFLARAYHFPAYCREKCINIWINHHGRISTKTILWSKCLSNFPLPDKCQSEFGWECSTQILQCCLMNPLGQKEWVWWCLCARRSRSSSSALLCARTHQVRHSCHSDPTPKASPILRRLLRDWFFPVPVQAPALPWNTIPNSKTSNRRHKDCSKLTGDNLCGFQWPQLISDREKGLPSKAESDDCVFKTRRGCVEESNNREKWDEIKGKNMFMQKNGPLKTYKKYLVKWKQDLNRWLTERKTLKS